MKIKTSLLVFIMLLTVNLIAQEQPNILIIQVDDMGFDDLSINGNIHSETPNLDTFSGESVSFSNFFVHSVCSPTRSSLLTGRDFWRAGVSAMHGGRDFLNLDETTFANIFQDNGYATGMWGKWHSGTADGYCPWDRGFDEAYNAKLYKYFPSTGWYNEYPNLTTHTNKWSAEVLANYTMDFMDRSKSQNKPFLAYLSFLSVHDVWAAPDLYVNKYKDLGHGDRLSTLLGMLEFMDLQVGRVLTYLKDNNLEDNTIVIFMSDNGPNNKNTEEADVWPARNVHGYLGNKSRLWQNGLKSPLYVKWNNANYTLRDVEELVGITDIFPTLLDLAGITLPENNKPLDGRSIKPHLDNNSSVLSPKKAIFPNFFPVRDESKFEDGVEALYQPMSTTQKQNLVFEDQRMSWISDDYKLLLNPINVSGSPSKNANGIVLVDLNTHPLENSNRADEEPDVVISILTEMENWFDGIKATNESFIAPEFQIGWNNKTKSEMYAYGPSKVNGANNGSHELSGFDDIGDYIEYTINVKTSGNYELDFRAANNSLSGITIKVSCNGKVVEKTFTENIIIQTVGSIDLSEGKHIFKIEIINKSIANGNFGNFKTIEFKRLGDVLGIEDNNNKLDFEVYPNPSQNGRFTLNRTEKWVIYNIEGLKILEGEGTSIKLSSFVEGVYFLKTKNGVKKLLSN